MLTKGRSLDPLLRSGCSVYFFGRKKQRNPVVVGDPRLQPFELQNKSGSGAVWTATTIFRTFVEAPIQRSRAFRGAMGLMDCPGFDGFIPVSPAVQCDPRKLQSRFGYNSDA